MAAMIAQVLSEQELTIFMHSQNRSEQISTLASGVAHEVRNPLAVISMGMEVLSKKFDFTDPTLQRVQSNILSSIQRATSIVENLMRLDAPQLGSEPLEPLPLGTTIDEALALVTFQLRELDIQVQSG